MTLETARVWEAYLRRIFLVVNFTCLLACLFVYTDGNGVRCLRRTLLGGAKYACLISCLVASFARVLALRFSHISIYLGMYIFLQKYVFFFFFQWLLSPSQHQNIQRGPL